jgi:hypothetical protein
VELARARECLDWLVSQQRASGAMPAWMKRDPFAEESRPVEMHGRDSFYMNGLVGRALLVGYEALREPRYLDAAIRIGEFNRRQPPSHNANYNAFCLLFQPDLSRVTGNPGYLDDAIDKWTSAIRRGQLLNGEWTGHNRLTNYMGIIGWGIGSLALALPEGHAVKRELRGRAIRMLNCFYRRLSGPGALRQEEAQGLNAGAWASQVLMTALTLADAFGLDTSSFAAAVANWLCDEAEASCPWARAYNVDALARYIVWLETR